MAKIQRSPRSSACWQVATRSETGRGRIETQDAWAVHLNALVAGRRLLLLGVFDGLGGHPGGGEAARAAATRLHEAAREVSTPGDLLVGLDTSVRATGGLTTAAVAMLLPDGTGWVATAGDSAVHLLGPGQTPAPKVPLDAVGPNTVTDCLGRLRAAGHCVPVHVPHGHGLLLSTDGVHRIASPSALQSLMLGDDGPRALAALFAGLRAAGLPDDATAILARRR